MREYSIRPGVSGLQPKLWAGPDTFLSMPESIDLDNTDAYAVRDPSGFGARLLRLPEMAREGWRLGGESALSSFDGPPDRVIMAAAGGSAIGGELIKGLAGFEKDAAEIVCWRDFDLPRWAERRTLVVAISVSGATAETRSALSEAVERRVPAVAITGPGPLRSEARSAGVPVVEIDYSDEPRTALAFTFLTPYRMLQRHGLMEDADEEFESTVGLLSKRTYEWRPESPVAENRAKQIALELADRIPVVWGGRHLLGVAMRWKAQFNENADSAAFWEPLPEATHNAVQGVFLPASLPDVVNPLVLASARYGGDLTARVEATLEAMTRLGLSARRVQGEAPSGLGEMLELTLLGDMASYYLAVLRGRDPSITPVLDAVKRGAGSAVTAR